MRRKLFCEISDLTYNISMNKEILKRNFKYVLGNEKYAKEYGKKKLEFCIYEHKSLIRRALGNTDMTLQENKARNLELSIPKINRIIIKKGEVFSFWKLVGNTPERKGYKEGLVIKGDKVDKGVGGGLCQFTNLIHWMVLHSPLDIIEHHHHNQFDLFPDFNRQVPFGTGTSIMYNYLDYQFKNNTDTDFQIVVYINDKYLCGELRASKELPHSYHVVEEDSHFVKDGDDYYRRNKVYKKVYNKTTGDLIDESLLIKNNSKTMYDSAFINKDLIRDE